jgi:hypothetical protein
MGVGCLLVLSIGMLSGSASFAANKTDPLVGPEVDTTSGPTEPQLPGPEIPALSSADKSDARAILVDDPRFEDLIQGNSYSISSTSVWTTHSQQKLGAALVVKIANGPVTISGDWPTIAYDESESTSPPYSTSVTHYKADKVSKLDALVDLGSDKVVSIEPTEDAARSETDSPTAPTSVGPLAASTNRLALLRIYEDLFYNYDFRSTTVSKFNVDWPVDFLYWNDATINSVKFGLGFQGYTYNGDSFWFSLNDGGGWLWDSDKGVKTILCPIIGTAVHTRLYAPSGQDYSFNLNWGFYVLGTAHYDHNECNVIGKWSGKSENAEQKIVSAAKRYWGDSNVHYDHLWFFNPEPERTEGNHKWLNSGYASTVRLP